MDHNHMSNQDFRDMAALYFRMKLNGSWDRWVRDWREDYGGMVIEECNCVLCRESRRRTADNSPVAMTAEDYLTRYPFPPEDGDDDPGPKGLERIPLFMLDGEGVIPPTAAMAGDGWRANATVEPGTVGGFGGFEAMDVGEFWQRKSL